MTHKITDHIGLNLLRATEATAMTAGRWMGFGKSTEADHAARLTMLKVLSTIDMDACIAVSRDQLDPTHSQLPDDQIGTGIGPKIDLVFDSVDGINQLALGYPGAISAIAVAPEGCMWAPATGVYMDKIVVDEEVAPHLVHECVTAPAAWTLALIARAKGKKVSDLTIFLLDRPRHQDLITEIRTAGARVMLRADGDISMGIKAAMSDTPIDLMMGAGGIPEGIMLACAVKALGGAMLGRLDPQSPAEQEAIEQVGLDNGQVLTVDDMVTGDEVFFVATGITGGSLLDGVRYKGSHAITNSLMLHGETHTQRRIITEHYYLPE